MRETEEGALYGDLAFVSHPTAFFLSSSGCVIKVVRS